jgi:predicted GNAT family acetyltransferase
VAATVTSWLVNRLLDDGAAGVALQASDAGRPIYERLGFRTVEAYRCFTFAPAAGDPSGS